MPNKVKAYVRRHLENPPKMCLCHKSNTVNNLRLKLIEKLKDDDDEEEEVE